MRPLALTILTMAVIVLIISLAWTRWPIFKQTTAPPVAPHLMRVSRAEAVIAWPTTEAGQGRVFYRPTGSDSDAMVAVEELARSYKHRVTLSGLQPGTRYTYWIDSPEHRFQFQTGPNANAPFSFIITTGQDAAEIAALVMNEMPDFIFDITPLPPGESTDRFAAVRAFQPVFGINGAGHSGDPGAPPASAPNAWRLNWGGLAMDVYPNPEQMSQGLPAGDAHTRGMVLAACPVQGPATQSPPDAKVIKRGRFHKRLTAMEKKTGPAFVLFPSPTGWHQEIDGIVYCALPSDTPDGAVRMDIDVGSATAVFLGSNRHVALKRPPLKSRITCEECRRLADRGTYEAAIEAYEAFIANNAGHFQIDDAYYAVAEILDEKLFRFDDALTWYRRLLDEYPQGTLTPLARQRIGYIETFSEADYAPLAAFERIRKIDFARHKDDPERRRQVLDTVETLIATYPQVRLAPVMRLWLATQLRGNDPQRAIQAFRRLRSDYPASIEARETNLQIADTLYAARQFRLARDTYRLAMGELPDLKEVIEAQIRRCNRNMRRQALAWAAGALLTGALAIGALLRPMGIQIRQAVAALAVFSLLSAVIFSGAWLIREQFLSTAKMVMMALGFSAAAACAGLIAGLLTQKLWMASVQRGTSRLRSKTRRLAGSLAGIILFMAGMYLTLYLINEHYLITVYL